jgi:hypothetical protein
MEARTVSSPPTAATRNVVGRHIIKQIRSTYVSQTRIWAFLCSRCELVHMPGRHHVQPSTIMRRVHPPRAEHQKWASLR